ncbi:MAG TPA: DUF4386 domain-containing protein, partial [Acidimicrobiia bacterium]|nr:DUF4386 domain-containing protein [Acidimicrobiia bacterium]
MTTATPSRSARNFATDTARTTALVAGVLYLVTFVSSIPTAFLLDPVLTDVGYIVGGGTDTRITWGTLLDIINALACIGTAVVLYPLVKRQSERLALGFVTTRVFEAAVIAVGVVSLLAVVTLRQEGTLGVDDSTLVVAGRALVAVRDWTVVFGPGLMPALNALLLGTLMYRSRLV